MEYILMCVLLLILASPAIESVFSEGGAKICRAGFGLENPVVEVPVNPNDPSRGGKASPDVLPCNPDRADGECDSQQRDRQQCQQLIEEYDSEFTVADFTLVNG